jgi:hypothetical protein
MAGACLRSIREFLPDWILVIVAQEYTETDRAFVESSNPDCTLIVLPERCGPHNAKLCGLRHINNLEHSNYIVCSIDDDMEFISQTNFKPCIKKALEPAIGFVSAGWVKHETRLMKLKPVDQFIKQAIVYTGGGMIFDRVTAQTVLRIPEGAYFCDNTEWSLAVYLTGLSNYRYRGSMTIHRICSKGGRKSWVEMSKKQIPDPRFLHMKVGKLINNINNYHVGDSKSLTPEAHAIHNANASKHAVRISGLIKK